MIRVMVVDDSPLVRKIAGDILRTDPAFAEQLNALRVHRCPSPPCVSLSRQESVVLPPDRIASGLMQRVSPRKG